MTNAVPAGPALARRRDLAVRRAQVVTVAHIRKTTNVALSNTLHCLPKVSHASAHTRKAGSAREQNQNGGSNWQMSLPITPMTSRSKLRSTRLPTGRNYQCQSNQNAVTGQASGSSTRGVFGVKGKGCVTDPRCRTGRQHMVRRSENSCVEKLDSIATKSIRSRILVPSRRAATA